MAEDTPAPNVEQSRAEMRHARERLIDSLFSYLVLESTPLRLEPSSLEERVRRLEVNQGFIISALAGLRASQKDPG